MAEIQGVRSCARSGDERNDYTSVAGLPQVPDTLCGGHFLIAESKPLGYEKRISLNGRRRIVRPELFRGGNLRGLINPSDEDMMLVVFGNYN